MKLYKTTITIYSDFDPLAYDPIGLANASINGDAYYAGRDTVQVDADTVEEGIQEFFNVASDDQEARSDEIKAEYLASGCDSFALSVAIGDLMNDCPDLFENDEAATTFLIGLK